MTATRAPVTVFVVLLTVYVVTLAPGVTFWDAGELISAVHTLGIPHPPGTPLFVVLGHVWSWCLSGALGVARSLNLFSAVCTAGAAAACAWLVGRESSAEGTHWGALAGALCAGLMSSAWANATETELYAFSLLHVALMLVAAAQSNGEGCHPERAEQYALEECKRRGEGSAAEPTVTAGAGPSLRSGRQNERAWLLLTVYLIALAPAVHLSALVGAPAAIVMASRRRDHGWYLDRVLLLGGAMVAAAGVGRMSWPLVLVGAALACGPIVVCAGNRWPRVRQSLAAVGLAAVAASALLILMLRARHDPMINQGNPSTLTTLADVVARRQYEVAPMWPRRAPIWLQITNVIQYLDWQFAYAWGRGIIASPARILVTLLFIGLGISGHSAMRRDARRVAEALLALGLCGTVGVCAYLNLKSGASIGYGFVPADAHEARERDYFFVLGFWAWGLFAGYGALAFVKAHRWPRSLATAVALVPLAGNVAANDRAHRAESTAPRSIALSLLESAPRNAVLFLAGDNDTYPIWYAQSVEGVRLDVTTVTLPLLPADWYAAEVERRTGLHWSVSQAVPGANWLHEQRAALIAAAARAAGRPIAATTQMAARDRSLLGSSWRLSGTVYVSESPADGAVGVPRIDALARISHNRRGEKSGLAGPIGARPAPARQSGQHLPDDVSAYMLEIFECPRLAKLSPSDSVARKSLEVSCNLR
ncbi:MAG: DUF2723 domain-containing protein [Gemmatimonadota bacterium]